MDELLKQTATITQPRQHRLDNLRKQCQILEGLINADEAPSITLEKIKPRGSRHEKFRRMAEKLTKKQLTKLLADTKIIELLVSRPKAASGDQSYDRKTIVDSLTSEDRRFNR